MASPFAVVPFATHQSVHVVSARHVGSSGESILTETCLVGQDPAMLYCMLGVYLLSRSMLQHSRVLPHQLSLSKHVS